MQVKIITECSLEQSVILLQNALVEHSAILLIFIKLHFVVKTYVLSIFSDRLRQNLLCIYIATCTVSSSLRRHWYAINHCIKTVTFHQNYFTL